MLTWKVLQTQPHIECEAYVIARVHNGLLVVLAIDLPISHTVYVKTFEGENFHGFRGF